MNKEYHKIKTHLGELEVRKATLRERQRETAQELEWVHVEIENIEKRIKDLQSRCKHNKKTEREWGLCNATICVDCEKVLGYI